MAVRVRKTVTVLFADVVGSTALGETFDPEAMRASLDRYFAAVREIVESHGGTVEKFIGDAVMAVFGIPEVHEDDALRAVRAAVEVRRRLTALELAVPLEVRIGVTTGEVVAGEGETFATGDAVNTAARLEAAAEPGEILLGAETYSLVEPAVRAEAVEPLSLKGKAEAVAAYRLLEVLPDAPAFTRRFDAPFVGRQHELGTLLGELARAVELQECRLAVVAGEPGIGKSRLVRELVQAQHGARVLVGRCLSYGDGITYWPLREIVQQIGDLARHVDATTANAVLGAVGLAPVAAQAADIHWAVRRLFSELAAERPLLVVLDDLHWAEPAFVDLVDYLHAFARDAPILLVAVGRPELFDARPAWRTSSVELEPLTASEAASLVAALDAQVPEAARARVVDTAEGNPLFLEQLVAVAAEGDVTVPPTVQAFLAARIDALPPAERQVVECGAVEGRLFHRGAVQELASDAADVMNSLLSLIRRQLVRADESLFPGDDAFRFAHALIRDAAYEAAPKSRRADLHERYAAWLRRASPPDAMDDLVAYHLEQAALLAAEVGTPRPDLAREAGLLLAAAGRRAIRRGDVGAAAGLLGRATALLPPSPERTAAHADQAFSAITRGDFPAAAEAVGRILDDPSADEPGRARAAVIETWLSILNGGLTIEEARTRLVAATAVLQAAADDWWVARATIVRANTCAMEARFGPAPAMLLPLFELRAVVEDPALRAELLFWMGGALMLGPVPVPEARAQLEARTPLVRTPLELAWFEFPLGMLDAYEGRFADARARFTRSRESMKQAGAEIYYGANSMFVGWMETVAGRPEVGESIAREGWELLGAAGEQGLRSSVGLHLASALAALGRDVEAEAIAAEAVALASEHDMSAQFHHRGVLALLRSRAGRRDEALLLARESVALALTTDSAWHRIEAYLFLAEVADGAERREAADEVLRLVDEHGLTVYRERALALRAA